MAKKVFLTGATGFTGAAILSELVSNGFQVLGLARSDEGEHALRAAGAEVFRGDLDDLDSMRKGAEGADAVIHTAFRYDYSKYKQNCEVDRQVVKTIGMVLAGSDRRFIVTSGTSNAKVNPGETATENSPSLPSSIAARAATEEAATFIAEAGVDVSVVRLPQIHDVRKQGLVSYAIDIARKKGLSAYVEDGDNRWAAASLSDTARLYRLALEKGSAGRVYHSVTEEGIAFRDIAKAIGEGLKIPTRSISSDDVEGHFTWFAPFAGRSNVVSSEITKHALGWEPSGQSLLSDLRDVFAR